MSRVTSSRSIDRDLLHHAYGIAGDIPALLEQIDGFPAEPDRQAEAASRLGPIQGLGGTHSEEIQMKSKLSLIAIGIAFLMPLLRRMHLPQTTPLYICASRMIA